MNRSENLYETSNLLGFITFNYQNVTVSYFILF